MAKPTIIVIGAGVAGLTSALELAERGLGVEVVERGRALGEGSCSWMAGGMLAPWCERATTEPEVAEWGAPSIDWWAERFPETVRQGSLVVAQPRDLPDLTRFAQRTERFDWLDADRHRRARARSCRPLPARAVLPRRGPSRSAAGVGAPWRSACRTAGVAIRFGVELAPQDAPADIVVDCRGLAARDALPDLRGVRGEMVVVRSPDVSLQRPVRLLHPRIPLYIVPRGNGLFMIGATMIESERARPGQRALGRRAPERGLCPASGLRRGRDRRARRRPAAGLPRQPAATSGEAAMCCTPTACSVTASCWRPRWRGARPRPSCRCFNRRRTMRIFLNDDAHDVDAATLAAALDSLGFGGRKIATAVNGRFVAAAARARHQARRRRPHRGRGADAGRLSHVLRRRPFLAPAAGHGALSVAGHPRARHQGLGGGGRHRLAAPRRRCRPR